MARFRCRACGQEDEFTYDPTRQKCPRCGSPGMQFALGIEEMPEELIDRIVQGLSRTETLDDQPTNED